MRGNHERISRVTKERGRTTRAPPSTPAAATSLAVPETALGAAMVLAYE